MKNINQEILDRVRWLELNIKIMKPSEKQRISKELTKISLKINQEIEYLKEAFN